MEKRYLWQNGFVSEMMNALQAFFSWRHSLGRRAYLGHSLPAALVFVLSLEVLLLALVAIIDSDLLVTICQLFLALLLLICAASTPFVPLLFCILFSFFFGYLYYASFSELSVFFTCVCAVFGSLLMVASALRLVALAVRRRRDAGKNAIVPFALISFLYTAAIVLGFACESSGILFAGFCLALAVQGYLFLLPSQN